MRRLSVFKQRSFLLVAAFSLLLAQCKKRSDAELAASGCPNGFSKLTGAAKWQQSVLGNNMPVGTLPGLVISLSVTMRGFSPVYDHKEDLDRLKHEIQTLFIANASTKKNDPGEKLFFTAMIIEANRISSYLRGTALKTQAQREATAGYAMVPTTKRARLDQSTLEKYFGVIDDSELTLHRHLGLKDADVKIVTKDQCVSRSFDVTTQIPEIVDTIKSTL